MTSPRDHATGRDERCIFCAAPDEVDQTKAGESSLVVFVGDLGFVILNKFPYSNGHLMVVPRRHVASLSEMTLEELHEVMMLTRRAEIALREAYAPDGLNVGINVGAAAGAGVPGHLHVHVVPRWTSDTNFMTVTADTRVVPEGLQQTTERLRPLFARLESDDSQ